MSRSTKKGPFVAEHFSRRSTSSMPAASKNADEDLVALQHDHSGFRGPYI